MQKVKDGYRASFRLNEDNPEHMEIYQMFQEPMNTGKYRNESDLYRVAQFYIKNHHEVIVSEEEWNMAQEIRKSRYGKNTSIIEGTREKQSRKFAFSSMCECAYC